MCNVLYTEVNRNKALMVLSESITRNEAYRTHNCIYLGEHRYTTAWEGIGCMMFCLYNGALWFSVSHVVQCIHVLYYLSILLLFDHQTDKFSPHVKPTLQTTSTLREMV